MDIKYSIKWYFLRWVIGFAYASDGLARIFTLGFWNPSLGLVADVAFLTESERCAFCPNTKLTGQKGPV